MAAPIELKRTWEKRFPDLTGAWTHWQVEGDGYLIGVVPGDRFLEAIRLLTDNHERYSSIVVARATANETGECLTVENARFVVSNRYDDAHLCNLSEEAPKNAEQKLK
jgi:hypothetical protein